MNALTSSQYAEVHQSHPYSDYSQEQNQTTKRHSCISGTKRIHRVVDNLSLLSGYCLVPYCYRTRITYFCTRGGCILPRGCHIRQCRGFAVIAMTRCDPTAMTKKKPQTRLIPLSWKLYFSTPEAKATHMDSLPNCLFQRITWNRTKDYFITFASSEQETTWLDIVNKDPGIVNIRPLREYLVNDGEMWEESTQSWRQLKHWQGYW